MLTGIPGQAGMIVEVQGLVDAMYRHAVPFRVEGCSWLLEAEDAGYHRLYRANADAAKVECLTEKSTDSDGSPATDAAGTVTVFLKNNFNHPAQLWCRTNGKQSRLVFAIVAI